MCLLLFIFLEQIYYFFIKNLACVFISWLAPFRSYTLRPLTASAPCSISQRLFLRWCHFALPPNWSPCLHGAALLGYLVHVIPSHSLRWRSAWRWWMLRPIWSLCHTWPPFIRLIWLLILLEWGWVRWCQVYSPLYKVSYENCIIHLPNCNFLIQLPNLFFIMQFYFYINFFIPIRIYLW